MGQPLITPQGTLVESMNALRTLLASTVAWQEWVGEFTKNEPTSAAVEAAREHIYLISLPRPRDPNKGYQKDELEARRPFAVIDFPPPEAEDEEAFVAESAGGGYFAHRGRLNLRFEADAIADLDKGEAKLQFMTRLGLVLEDMTDLANTSGFLAVRETRLWCPPIRSDEIEETGKGDFFTADVLISWGLRPGQRG